MSYEQFYDIVMQDEKDLKVKENLEFLHKEGILERFFIAGEYEFPIEDVIDDPPGCFQ